MAGSTTNYGATKPAEGEAYDVDILNNNSDIFDAAIKAEAHKVQHLELVRQGHVASTGIIGPGPLAGLVESATSKNYSDWISFPADDQFTLSQEGIYDCTWKIVPNATATFWHSISDGGAAAATLGRSQAASVAASDSYWCYTGNFYVPVAGLTVNLKFSLAAGTTINHRVKITKVK